MTAHIKSLLAVGVAAAFLLGGAPLGAEEMDTDMRVRIEALEEAIDGLTKKSEEHEKAFMEGFTDIRYDDERVPNANTGLSGIFVRRAEFKFSGNVLPTLIYSLGYDFAENKLKDVGVEVKDLPLLPFVDMPEWAWNLRVGQYRMPFGIVPQTSSSAILFPERPMIFGGKNLTGGQTNGTTLVKERVMGFQGRLKKKFGIVGADLQGGGFNNATEDQAAGKNKVGAADAFPAQVTDQDLSWMARLALELNLALLEKTRLQLGGSFIRDSANTAWNAQLNSKIKHDEYIGAEGMLEILNKMLVLQAEYARRQVAINAVPGALITGLKEGWYADLAFDTLPLFMAEREKGDGLFLIGRFEEQSNFAATGFSGAVSRLGGGLKWTYAGGKNHTSINYFVTAPNQMFGGDYRATADGGTGRRTPETMLIIQQQFAFETGKPK